MKFTFFYKIIFFLSFSGLFSLQAQTFDTLQVLNLVKILSHDSLQGRKTGTYGNKKTQELIVDIYKKYQLMSLNKNFMQFFKGNNDIKGSNVIGYVSGSVSPEKYIILSAHFDHLGVEKGKIFNGADDNASGVGGLVAAIEYFSKKVPRHSIIFAAFDAEEAGLEGSKAFVKNPPIPLEKILLNINMDMISRSKSGEIYACGTSHYPFLRPLIENAFTSDSKKVQLKFGHDVFDKKAPSHDWTNSSDHGSFHKKKIPFIYFGVEDHEDYHQPTDDFEKINTDFYLSTIKLIINTIEAIDRNLETLKK